MRRRVTALNFFPALVPPTSGGELRYYHIYKYLGRHYEIDMVSPTHPFVPPEVVRIGDHVVERRVPKSQRHVSLQRLFDRVGRFPECSAVVVSLTSYVEPGYKALVRELRSTSDIVIHEFPFLFLHARKRPGQLLVYDAHNVEFDLQRTMLHGPLGAVLCQYVKRLESLACRESDLIFVTSSEDRGRIIKLYGVSPDKVHVAPNGVDVGSVPCISETERQDAKRRVGVDGHDVMLFIGSYHPPNIEAVNHLIEALAPKLPEKIFLVAGGVGRAIASAGLPDNVICLGRVSDDARALLLQIADVALNPMFSGSGTNIKMLEYLAAGLPVIATPVGARGLDVVNGEHAIVSSIDRFPGDIERVLADGELRAGLRSRGRRLMEEKYDWAQIVEGMYEVIESAFASMR